MSDYHRESTYKLLMTCDVGELRHWYKAFVNDFPAIVAPLVKALAESRGFDTSDWPPFTR